MRASLAPVWVDVCMHVCFSEVGLSPVTEMSHSPWPLNPALMNVINSTEWTPWYKKKWTNAHSQKKENKNRDVLDPQDIRDHSFPDSSGFTVHACHSPSSYWRCIIHLLDKGEVVEENVWWAEVKGQEDDRGRKGQRRPATFLDTFAESSIGHKMNSSPWPEVTQDSSTARDHLLIICSFTNTSVLFVFVHTLFFFFFFGFLTHFWEICGFKMAGQT